MSVIPKIPRASGGQSPPGLPTRVLPWTSWGTPRLLMPPPNHKSWIRTWLRYNIKDYVDREDSAWRLRLCNFDLEIFCFNLTFFFIMIILLTTVYQCYKYLIRETDLHKFYNLLLNLIELCKYIWLIWNLWY